MSRPCSFRQAGRESRQAWGLALEDRGKFVFDFFKKVGGGYPLICRGYHLILSIFSYLSEHSFLKAG